MFEVVNYKSMVSHSYFLATNRMNCLVEVLIHYKDASLEECLETKRQEAIGGGKPEAKGHIRFFKIKIIDCYSLMLCSAMN